jgi:4-hydroxybenzoate polyprenyltransferase
MKKILRGIWDEFTEFGWMAGLSAFCIVFVGALLADISITPQLYLISFTTGYVIYFFDSIVDSPKIAIKRVFLPAALFLVSLFIGVMSNIITAITLATLVGLGILYNLSLKSLTRYFLGFKSIFVALVFPLVLLYPLQFSSPRSSVPIIFLLYCFLSIRFFLNTVFCDIKDVKEDRASQLKTYANTLSPKSFRIFWHVINILSITPLIFGSAFSIFPKSSLALLLVVPYSFIYWWISKFNMKVSIILADGEPYLWALLLIIGGIIWI